LATLQSVAISIVTIQAGSSEYPGLLRQAAIEQLTSVTAFHAGTIVERDIDIENLVTAESGSKMSALFHVELGGKAEQAASSSRPVRSTSTDSGARVAHARKTRM
jgi:hypothetical protein